MTKGYNILDADSYLFVSLLEDVATLVKMLRDFWFSMRYMRNDITSSVSVTFSRAK